MKPQTRMSTRSANLLPLLMTGLLALGGAFEARAAVLDWHDAYKPTGTGDRASFGGEFTVLGSALDLRAYGSPAIDVLATGSFQSFCLEINEQVFRRQEVSFELSPSAVLGGPNKPGVDPISLGTAWLYAQFATGSLADYAYHDLAGGGRRRSAAMLQEAIWYLEEEIVHPLDASQPQLLPVSNPYYDGLIDRFGSIEMAMSDANGSFNVHAINIYIGGNFNAQDQLYLAVPDSSSSLELMAVSLSALVLSGTLASRKGLLKPKNFKAHDPAAATAV